MVVEAHGEKRLTATPEKLRFATQTATPLPHSGFVIIIDEIKF